MKLIVDKLLDYLENIKYYIATISKYEDGIEVVGLFREKKDAYKALLLKLAEYGLLIHYPDSEDEEEDCYPMDVDEINQIDFESLNLANVVELMGNSYYKCTWDGSVDEVKPS